MKNLKQAQRALFWFGLFKIPMIRFARPRVVEINDDRCVISIPFRRRTKNHLGGIYIAAYTIGADLAAGFLAFYLIKKHHLKASIAFKSMSATYHKRAEEAVYFTCDAGKQIVAMIEASKASGERQNEQVPIPVTIASEDDPVSDIEIELSLKVIQ